jgi:nitroimidazol reductase NimA-like FMN-containing flavoprotein (pyridoxamine 5'-phosphate oxidase superfamily)
MDSDLLGEVQKFLNANKIPVRLAFQTKSNWPIVISLWFLYQDGLLYCATQDSAKIVGHLQKDPRCAFEISGDYAPYCGVRGQARARVEKEIGAEILDKLIYRYLGGSENDLAQKLLAKRENEVAIVLEPIWIKTWDFSNRMKHIDIDIPDVENKICP